MKLTYYSYYLKLNDSRIRTSIADLLRSYANNGSSPLKRSFLNKSGQSIFLIQQTHNLFALLTTKDDELIKKINADDFTYEDIYDDLEANEKIGFASYIHMDTDHYGIVSTSQGPKNSSFLFFIEQLFNILSLPYEFVSRPFPVQVSTTDVMRMNSVGRTTIEVNQSNNAFQILGQLFGGALPNELDAIEVTFKPRRSEDIKELIPVISELVEGEGLNKYIVRAKENLDESLSDFYIAGNGFINDYIDADETGLAAQIAQKKLSNQSLNTKLLEFRSDRRYTNDSRADITAYHNADSWSTVNASFESVTASTPDVAEVNR
ncbi:hypothetical protein FQP88_09025 [Vibrio atlanticus]|nr:hypothetical protein FQP88_09025 [Vibrio atlanticus]